MPGKLQILITQESFIFLKIFSVILAINKRHFKYQQVWPYKLGLSQHTKAMKNKKKKKKKKHGEHYSLHAKFTYTVVYLHNCE